VEIPPNINNTACLKEAPKRRRTLPRTVSRVRTKAINSTVKDRIEIASQDSRNGGINHGMKIIQELITCRVAIGAIDTTNTKRPIEI